LDVALKWQSMGAPRLHVVDLDGAATGEPRNVEIIKAIASVVLIPVELGGGIRHIETVEKLLKLGIERVILGTAAVEDPQLIKEACRRFPDSIVVGIDARDGHVATRGWLKDNRQTAVSLANLMVSLGVKRFIYTDISRDGTLTEPNFSAFSELKYAVEAPVIASGGISNLNHLRMLKKLGAEGAIVGKALYTGDINLRQAIAEVNQLV
jgi:phosphoribosylformimino-5-aminoimidazole carboxamide ribotide isomerase